MKEGVTFIDLCSGAGGFSDGFKQAGWTPLLGVDSCANSLLTYKANIGADTLCVDLLAKGALEAIQKALGKKKPTAVIAGPPCQGFSMAGRRDPTDPRNRVFVECARHAVALKPELIIFENVPYIAQEPFRTFLRSAAAVMRAKGYKVIECEVEAGCFNVPQRRRRLLFVAIHKGYEKKVRAVLDNLCKLTNQNLTVKDAWKGLPSDCLSAAAKKVHNHEPMKHGEKVKKKIAGIPIGKGPLSYRKLHPNKPALTLIAGHSAMPCHYIANRTITVREAARIQGFRDDFIFHGGLRSQMNQVANAVPPKIGQKVGREMLGIFSKN